MEFFVLGPLTAGVGDERLDLGSARQRIVLAALLLDANRTVTVSRLMEAIYGHDPPVTSRSQVQNCVSALRRLFDSHGHPDLIVTTSQGYALQIPGARIDAQRFRATLVQARQARDGGRQAEAIDLYRAALSLWRGPVLDGVESRLVQSAAGRLTEQRITTVEECVQLELERGGHHELVDELARFVKEYPLREKLRGLLMTALYRSDQRAEALEVYRQTRQTWAEELGIEPNEHLQRLQRAILARDESLNPPDRHTPGAVERVRGRKGAPGMLPPSVADFTGRTEQLAEIRAHLTGEGARERSRLAVPVVVIVGKAGIGKTSIALHIAHAIAGHSPDGQLFATFQGGSTRPVGPLQVLERFLRALGVSGSAMPEGLEERAETYRDLLAARRTLVVLDDVVSESQVLPLLPGNPESAVIVTSRRRLPGLAGAAHVDVAVFEAEQSLELLSRIAGAERTRAEPEAADALAELCGHLPLALRIVGTRLAARPRWSLGRLVELLQDETHRLDELRYGDMGIRAGISLTYDGLGEEARRLFRRLAIMEAPVFSAWAGAALLDRSPAETDDLLDDLADAQLIEIVGAGRGLETQYRFHDLIRVFARERLAAEESFAERNDALARMLGGLLFIADAVRDRYYGRDVVIGSDAVRWALPAPLVAQFAAAPLAWLERERPFVLSAVRQAAHAGFAGLCWDLAMSIVPLFESKVYLDDWRESHEIALAAARRSGDRRGQGAILTSLSTLCHLDQRPAEAFRLAQAAVTAFEEAGEVRGAALATRHIGMLDWTAGRAREASSRYERALETFRATGDRVAVAYVLNQLAQMGLERGDTEGAERQLREALRLSREGDGRRVEAQVLYRMGHARLNSGGFHGAGESFERALAVVRDLSDPIGEVHALHGLGLVRLRQGEFDEAATALRRALTLARATNQRLIEARVLLGLGESSLRAGQAGQAVDLLKRALALFGRYDNVTAHEARALSLLGDARRALGETVPPGS
ncbi:AfsR/SARP family transcriptional regulator [Streptosporangium lutulentum]|uniref:DNA-binding SARP family transcriptional activator/Tfp pilus assembly protein PilF n=1 Tax=Streptosporangium lutulentum TaxID=1461250 RepID=A0ABT9Q4Q1_9ACTN|nr:BTAD domain-containing putative transcriptional regulator [Streptosporangium lutulentum]MDP9841711.1 DNA-binding SARP family transcriptional activator/Tfp pilus assembly protein PilF [Streptosporangium lutulentum]